MIIPQFVEAPADTAAGQHAPGATGGGAGGGSPEIDHHSVITRASVLGRVALWLGDEGGAGGDGGTATGDDDVAAATAAAKARVARHKALLRFHPSACRVRVGPIPAGAGATAGVAVAAWLNAGASEAVVSGTPAQVRALSAQLKLPAERLLYWVPNGRDGLAAAAPLCAPGNAAVAGVVVGVPARQLTASGTAAEGAGGGARGGAVLALAAACRAQCGKFADVTIRPTAPDAGSAGNAGNGADGNADGPPAKRARTDGGGGGSGGSGGGRAGDMVDAGVLGALHAQHHVDVQAAPATREFQFGDDHGVDLGGGPAGGATGALRVGAAGPACSLGDAFVACAVTDRPDGLFTTVVVDEHEKALGLVYSSAASVRAAVASGRGVYYSRSRRGIWRKGDTSGAWQRLRSVALDCDGDALRFMVRQMGENDHGVSACFCHTGSRDCWGWPRALVATAAPPPKHARAQHGTGTGAGAGAGAGAAAPVATRARAPGADGTGLQALERILASRKRRAPPGSYTKRLFDDATLLRNKLLEEAQELAEAEDPDHVAAETADVMYFALVAAVRGGATLADVCAHLDRRHLKVKRRPGNAKAYRIKAAAEILAGSSGGGGNGAQAKK